MILLLPGDIHSELFVENRDVSHPLAMTIAFGILIMMFLWLGQCLYTVVLVIRRLITHRAQLKHLYSNKEQRDLSWLSWLTFHAVIVWFVTLSTLFTSNLFDHWLLNETNEAILALFLIWSLCHFGLQQRPVNSEQSSNAVKTKVNVIENNEQKPATKKYQRSALGNEQATRIASKINKAMKDDALYLDADLSLQKLANILGISPNYISQTLNETLKSNFFDFVNHWRIEAAKPLVLANQHSILNIALDVGFNARSSFYKAFKKETGNTPSEFRKSNAPLCQWVRENEDGAK
mgnify:CR=1 FL=1